MTSIRKYKPNYLGLTQGTWAQTPRSSLGNLVWKRNMVWNIDTVSKESKQSLY